MAYHLLALNAQRVVLYEGMGNSIHEVPLKGIPLMPGSQELGRNEGLQPAAARQKGQKKADRVPYGQGGAKEHAQADLEKFFRTVAKTIWKQHLRLSSKPLILAAPRQHQPLFRKVAQIPVLLESGVVADPAGLSAEDLKAEARRVLEPEIQRRMEKTREEFGLARSRSQGSEDLGEVAKAVAAGRVKTLLVESGRRIWGIFDPQGGEILPGDPSRNAHDVDLLDELAEATLAHAGQVFVLPTEQMPTRGGIAAIFRF
jgi:stalled ribosome rescue protein Dom34